MKRQFSWNPLSYFKKQKVEESEEPVVAVVEAENQEVQEEGQLQEQEAKVEILDETAGAKAQNETDGGGGDATTDNSAQEKPADENEKIVGHFNFEGRKLEITTASKTFIPSFTVMPGTGDIRMPIWNETVNKMQLETFKNVNVFTINGNEIKIVRNDAKVYLAIYKTDWKDKDFGTMITNTYFFFQKVNDDKEIAFRICLNSGQSVIFTDRQDYVVIKVDF